TMENYWFAKQRLFDGRLGKPPKTSVINVDDPHGVELADRLEREGLGVVRYAVKSDADITARDPEFSLSGMRFRLRMPNDEIDFRSPLVGPPHIYNTLAAVASGLALGYKVEVITRAKPRSEEHTSELQSRGHLVCRLLLEKKKNNKQTV